MRHPIRWTLAGLAVLPLLLAVIANGIAASPSELPPPNPSMLITMPDGRQQALFQVLARSDLVQEVTGRDTNGEPVMQETRTNEELLDRDPEDRLKEAQELLERLRDQQAKRPPPADGDIYGLAEYALEQGDHEQALALFRSLPTEHPRYARAQRRIGWDIYTKAMDEPDLGLGFVNRSVMESPTEGNAWQDAYRVYAATLGLSVN